jgi:hypothetical protein
MLFDFTLEGIRLGPEHRRFQVLGTGGKSRIGIDGSFGGGTDGEFEALDLLVPEPDRPHDGIAAAKGLHHSPKGHEIGITTDLYGLGGTNLYTGVALPAHVHRPVVGLILLLIKDHKVIGTDILTGCTVLGLASVTLIINNETRHWQLV